MSISWSSIWHAALIIDSAFGLLLVVVLISTISCIIFVLVNEIITDYRKRKRWIRSRHHPMVASAKNENDELSYIDNIEVFHDTL